jgi:hypothetical protein
MITILSWFHTVQYRFCRVNQTKQIQNYFSVNFCKMCKRLEITQYDRLAPKNVFLFTIPLSCSCSITNMSPIKLCYTTEGIYKFRNRCLANVTKSGSLVASNLAGKGRRAGGG